MHAIIILKKVSRAYFVKLAIQMGHTEFATWHWQFLMQESVLVRMTAQQKSLLFQPNYKEGQQEM